MDEAPPIDVPEAFTELKPTPRRPSRLRRVFRNRFGHWRAGWRLLVYFTTAFVIANAISAPLKLFLPNPNDVPFSSWAHLSGYLVGGVAMILAGLALLRWFDRRPTGLLGLGFGRGWLREVSIGLVAGVVMTGCVVLILVATGSISVEVSPDLGASMAALPLYLALFALAAAMEELLFRGYPLQAFAEGSRRWIAAVGLCLPFTIGHYSNPDLTVFGALNIFLLGILLTVTYFKTLRLWLPIGLHLSWNLAQSWLWGFDVSGIAIENQLFVINPTGAEVLTGGGFGLEGSALTTLVVAAVLGWLLFGRTLDSTPEMKALWASYPSGFSIAPVSDAVEERQLAAGSHEATKDRSFLAEAEETTRD
ncbi:MAG: lysostaphin resistance A-like protein, partial [Thermoanaerobaculales bacterium]